MADSPSQVIINQIVSICQQGVTKYPNEWLNCHRKNAAGEYISQAHDWIILVARDLYDKVGSFVGCNGKRGNIHDPSMDAIAIMDSRLIKTDVRVIDMVKDAGIPTASVVYNDVTAASPGVFINPRDLQTYAEKTGIVIPPGPIKPPINLCPNPAAHIPKEYVGDSAFSALGIVLFGDYHEARVPPNSGMSVWFGRVTWDFLNSNLTMEQSIAKHRKEWRSLLGLPV